MRRPQTKADEWRWAANILWLSGVFLTAIYVISANESLAIWYYPLVFIACMALQYAMTKLESPLFTGSDPPPWSEASTTQTNWLWGVAVVTLLIDVLINLGGVGWVARFVKDSASGDVLKSEFGTGDTGLNIITGFMIFAFAILFAIGSEICRLKADRLQTPVPETVTFEEAKAVYTPPVSDLSPELQKTLNAARQRTEIPVPTTRRPQ